jgi:acetyltransferase
LNTARDASLINLRIIMTTRNLDKMFEPRSVALIGASSRPGSVGYTMARNLTEGGFDGTIYFVNPRGAEIEGRPCWTSIDALPEAPDLALVATPPETIPGVIDELGRKGTRAACIVTAGIRGELAQRMLDAAKPYVLRIVGPNCIGLLLPIVGVNGSFAHIAPISGDLVFLSQSGAIITSVLDWAAGHGVGFSQMVSIGDMSDVDLGDLLDYFAGDVKSRAILLYLESITNARKFMSAARRAARAKPVIVIKAGRHAESAKAAASHTGALAGADSVYEAAFHRAGLLRVNDLDELFDAAETLSRLGSVPGERLTVLTNGGGAGVLAADRLGDYDGHLARLSDETITALDGLLPATWSRGNPVDIIGDAQPDRYRDAIGVLLNDENIDAILVINCPTALASSTDAAQAILSTIESRKISGRPTKPLLANWLGEGAARDGRKLFEDAGVPSFNTPSDAVRGFMQLVQYSQAQRALMRTPPALPDGFEFDAAKASELIAGVVASGRSTLTEPEAKAVLAAYGVTVAPTYVASDPASVRQIAERILGQRDGQGEKEHKSCVIKILSNDISHKSDVGGVRLDIGSPEEAEKAAVEMLELVRRKSPNAHLDGFSVQPMIRMRCAHELIIGVNEDPTFGPVIMFGAGGTSVEAVADTAIALPPLDITLAHDLMRSTRIHRVLKGYRDHPPVNLDAIALALVKISYLTANHPEIRELDINPLLVNADGLVALDARIVVADEALSARAPMAIRPYPRQWEVNCELPGVGPLHVRPIRPDDEPLYQALMDRMTPSDLRLRLLAPSKNRSHKFLARLTQLDYAREIGFAMFTTTTGRHEMLGAAHLAANPDYTSAEYAIMVRSDLKNQGLGWFLMNRLISYAKAEGLNELHGSVLSENSTMLNMCRELGFRVSRDPEDLAVMHVALDLSKMSPETLSDQHSSQQRTGGRQTGTKVR